MKIFFNSAEYEFEILKLSNYLLDEKIFKSNDLTYLFLKA